MEARTFIVVSGLLGGITLSAGAEPLTPDGRGLAEDPRLAVKATLAIQDQPLGAVLTAFGRDIHVRLRASRETTDDKVTLFLDQRPAAEVMELLARQFDFHWSRTASGYVLTQSRESQEREAIRRGQALQARLAALQTEMERRPPLEGTPRGWMEAREQEIAARIQSDDADDFERDRLTEERTALMATLHPGRVPAVAIFRSLTLSQVEQLLTGRDLWLTSADGTLSPRVVALLRQAEEEAGRLPAWSWYFQFMGEDRWPPKEEEVVVRLFDTILTLEGSPPQGEPHYDLQFLLPIGSEEHRYRSALVGWSAAEKRAPLPLAARSGSDAPDLQRAIDWPDPAWEAKSGGRDLRLSDVAAALHRATGLEIVADSFTRARLNWELLAPPATRKTIAQVLDLLAGDLDYEWRKEGSLILLRSRSAAEDRREEVPERILAPWRQGVGHRGGVTLDDLAALAAAVTDAQARGLHLYWDWYFEASPAVSRTTDAGGFFGGRQHLRFWASLTPRQKEAVRAGLFLPVARMSLAQRQAFSAALQSPGGSSSERGGLRRPSIAPEIATGGFHCQMEGAGSSYTFSYHLAGEPEPSREVQFSLRAPLATDAR